MNRNIDTEAKVLQKVKKEDGTFVSTYPMTVIDAVLMEDKQTTLLTYISALVEKISTLETELEECKNLVKDMQDKMVTWE